MTTAWRRRRLALQLPLWMIVLSVVAAFAWTAWLGQAHLAGHASVLDRAEAALADLRLLLAGPRDPSASVAIVAIDDATVQDAGRYPLDRRRLADIVNAIRDARARALAVDLLFVDAGDAGADAELGSALSTMPTVIAGAGRFAEGRDLPKSRVPRAHGEMWPLAVFAQGSSVGLVNIVTDAGGTPRHVPLVFLTAGGPTPSLVLRAAGLFAGTDAVLGQSAVRLADVESPLDLGWHLPLRFFGSQRAIETLGASEVLADPKVRARLEGRLVFLGVTASAVGDRFSTPFDPVLPGVEILATAAAHLLDGSGLVRDERIRRIDVAAASALALLGIAALAMTSLGSGVALFAAVLAGWLAAITVLFAQGYWLSAVLPLAGPVPVVAALAIVRERLDRNRAREIARSEQMLSRLQAPALAQRIAKDPAFLREPVEQRAAVLFIDLSGFTGLSERLGELETRRFLKAFHTLVVDVSQSRGGVVMAFMGDGAMIVFGLPEPAPDDAARALETAFELARSTRAWLKNAGLDEQVSGLRVGAHCGMIVLSRLGHDDHQHITATGDSVNVASRLVEVGREHGAAIAASSDLLAASAEAASRLPAFDVIRDLTIRGRRARMQVAFWMASAI